VLVADNKGIHTGGEIDEGLLDYMECFLDMRFEYGVKADSSATQACNEIHFAGKRRFSDLSNTAMYFPFLYAPQALALFIGERSGLTVGESYYLARLLTCCAALALLMCAMIIYPVPPAVLALFIMPMCLFQLSSASLDAVSFAVTVLAACLFQRASDRKLAFSTRMHVGLAACFFLLATSRIIYVALIPLLLVLYLVRRSLTYIVSFVVILGLSSTWIVFALMTVHGQGAIVQETSSSDIIKYYLARPSTFLRVVFATFTDSDTLHFCWNSFVGILGWLDTPIGSTAYVVLALELVATAAVSNSIGGLRSFNTSHLALVGAAGTAMLLLLLVALSAWTIHPATLVDGIQGRYLYPIAILLLFAFWTSTPPNARMSLSWAILIIMAISSVGFAVPRLIDRYAAH